MKSTIVIAFASILLIPTCLGADTLSGSIEEKIKELHFQGDLRISVVYLTANLNDDYYEYVPAIEQAYKLKGRNTVSSLVNKTYFPAPLSYPFMFSDHGINQFITQLKNINEIDQSSIEIKDFPNIPILEQDQYEEDELRFLLVTDKYVTFKVKGLDFLEVAKFPAFVVLNFDFSNKRISSIERYQEAAKAFLSGIKSFNKLSELKNFLEIGRNRNKWSNAPILVFATMQDFGIWNIDFFNRYFAGGITDEKRKKFLSEISLREHGKEADKVNGGVQFFDNVIHEYSEFNIWRFYYGYNPPLFDGQNIGTTELGKGNRAILKRILKSAIFIHTTLPITLDKAQALSKELDDKLKTLKQDRLDFFDSFSNERLLDFHKKVSDGLRFSQQAKASIYKMREAKNGIDDFVRYMHDPFEIPLEDPNVAITDDGYDKHIKSFQRLFYYEKGFNLNNDRTKLNDFRKSLSESLEQLDQNLAEYNIELSHAQEILATRQNLREGRKNTVLSIVVPAFGALIFGLLVYRFPGLFEWILQKILFMKQ